MADVRINPFAKAAPTAPTAPKAAPQTEPTAPTAPKAPKATGEKKKRSPELTPEQMKQVIALIKTGQKSYSEIAEEVGITKFQVNRVLMTVRSKIKKAAEANPALAGEVEKILESLKRPAETRPGAKGPKGGKVANAIDDLVAQLLSGL